jgi:hypothetical protein
MTIQPITSLEMSGDGGRPVCDVAGWVGVEGVSGGFLGLQAAMSVTMAADANNLRYVMVVTVACTVPRAATAMNLATC